MTEIIEPSQDANKDPASAAWEKQITEATNNIQYQLDNINESVTESTPKVAVYSLDSTGTNQQFEPLAGGEGFVTYVDYTDTLPTLPVSGLVFTAYSETQVNTTIYQYRRTGAFGTFPPNPGTVSYNTSNGAWTETTDWQKTVPSDDGGTPIFEVSAKIAGSGTVVAKWSNPKYLNTVATGEGFVYFTTEQASAPSTPSATDYNYVTGGFTGLTAGWQATPVSVNVTDTTKKHWQSHFKAETAAGRNVATVTFQTPTGYIAIGSNLQSDNFNGNLANLASPGTAGWGIARASGNAIFNNVAIRGTLNASDMNTGTLNASNVNITNLDAGSITTGNLSATRINGGTLTVGNVTVSGSFVAQNLNVGVILNAVSGSGAVGAHNNSGTTAIANTVFQAHNVSEFNTYMVIFMTAAAWVPGGSQVAAGIAVRTKWGTTQGSQPNLLGYNSGTATCQSGRDNVTQPAAFVTTNLTKGYYYSFDVSWYNTGAQDPGAGIGSVIALEVRREV